MTPLQRWARWTIRFRLAIVLATATLTAAAVVPLATVRSDDDVLQFLPTDHPEVELFKKVNQRFGGLDVAIIGIETDNLFSTERLTTVRRLTRALSEIDGVADVLSFTDVPDPRPSPFGLVVAPLVGQIPATADELAALRERVLANHNAVDNLISPDGTAAMILCFLSSNRPSVQTATELKRVSSEIWSSAGLYFAGSPFVREYLAVGTNTDLLRLTPFVIAVVLLITFVIFRRPQGVLLSLVTVGISVFWIIGGIGLRNGNLTVVESSLPALLIAIGSAYTIHVLTAYFSGSAATVHARIEEALEEMGMPVAASALTTAVGFLSFLAMDVEPMRRFGTEAALGVIAVGLLSLTFVPACLAFGHRLPTTRVIAPLSRSLGRVADWSARHRVIALLVAGTVSAVGLIGLARIAPDATLKTFFREDSEPHAANAFLDRRFGGSVYLQVYLEGDLRSPHVLAELRKIVEYVEGLEPVITVSSIIDPLTTLSEALGGRGDLPRDRDRTRSLYPFLEGSAAIHQIIAEEKNAALVQIRLADRGAEGINEVLRSIRGFIDNEVMPSVSTIRLAELSPSDRLRFTTEWQETVGRRILRLLRISNKQNHSPDAPAVTLEQLVALFQRQAQRPTSLVPGYAATVEKISTSYFNSDDMAFDPPDSTAAADDVLEEWRDREQHLGRAIQSVVETDEQHAAGLAAALQREMPHLNLLDPEGVSIAAQTVAELLHVAFDELHARDTLAALNQLHPLPPLVDDGMRDRIVWALAELTRPSVGLPAPDPNGSRPAAVRARVTGAPVLNIALADSTIRNQLKSLIIALFIVALLLALLFRSPVTALKALVPSLCMLTVSVGVMGAAHIPLDVSTSMIAAIALGIGVDYAVHFLWRRLRKGESLARTGASVGPAIAINAVQVACGFAVLSISRMLPMQRFGLLVAMTMVLSAFGTFILLPALRADDERKPHQ